MMTGFARTAVAAVWLYEGLWCKILGGDGDQRAIVGAVPLLPPALATAALVGIGLAETAIAAWVLTGRRARAAAVTQTVLLVAFNAGGLLFAGDRIGDAGRMLTANAALLALAWLLARPSSPRRRGRVMVGSGSRVPRPRRLQASQPRRLQAARARRLRAERLRRLQVAQPRRVQVARRLQAARRRGWPRRVSADA